MRIKFSVNLWGIEKIRGAFTFGVSCFGACFGPCAEDTGYILYIICYLSLTPLLTAIQTQYEQGHRLIC